AHVCGLVVEATGAGRQYLEVADAATLRSDGGALVDQGGEITLQGGELTGGPLTNLSNTVRGHGTISADILNQGLITAASTKDLDLLCADLQTHATGELHAQSGARVWIAASTVSQQGRLEARPLGLLSFAAPLINAGSGSIDL